MVGAKILAPSYRVMAGFSQMAFSVGLIVVSFLSSSHSGLDTIFIGFWKEINTNYLFDEQCHRISN